jgi:Obg family GTPase CgtA-like protein
MAVRRARRATTLDGRRLGVVVVRPGASTAAIKRSTGELLARIAARIAREYRLAGVATWHKSQGTPSAPKELDEIAAGCDVVVMGIGDCRNGSASRLTDVFELERRGVPVAYIDTPCRIPRVSRANGVYVVEYAYLERWAKRWRPSRAEDRGRLEQEFQNQGLARALRQAGCRPGDRVNLAGREFEVWDRLLDGETDYSDGIKDYEYVVTEPLDKNDPDEIVRRASKLTPRVVAMLVRSP